jgi:arsenate reductase
MIAKSYDAGSPWRFFRRATSKSIVCSMTQGPTPARIFPGKRHLDWDLPNPDRKSWNEVWAIRDEIDSRVQQVLEELVGTRG